MKRRTFFTGLAATPALVPLAAQAGAKVEAGMDGGEAVPPPPMVELGRTGIRTSRLAQGTGVRGGNRQSNHTRQGFGPFVDLLLHGYARGVRFFDLADLYGTHVYFREALRQIPRDEVTILTKLWFAYDGRNAAEVPRDFQKRSALTAIERFRHELGVDTIDILLLHCTTAPKWPEDCSGHIAAMEEAKEKGWVRAIGTSCHSLVALRQTPRLDWLDVVLTRINPEGAVMDGPVADVLPVQQEIHAAGKAVIGMKIYGEGRLTGQKERCMEFAQKLGILHAMTIGSESKEQVDDNLRLMAKYPAA